MDTKMTCSSEAVCLSTLRAIAPTMRPGDTASARAGLITLRMRLFHDGLLTVTRFAPTDGTSQFTGDTDTIPWGMFITLSSD